MPLELTSSVFRDGEPIPRKYTCDGEDISPLLRWSDPPQDTSSFALVADDPDAPVGTWVHWVLFNLPAETSELPEAIATDGELPDGSRHGENGWGRLGYGGPCPPRGTHRYFFKLYALDAVLDLASGASKKELLQAMEGHILGQTELVGVVFPIRRLIRLKQLAAVFTNVISASSLLPGDNPCTGPWSKW